MKKKTEIEKVPYKSKLAKYKDIEKRNDAFDNLSPDIQRKEIAYDALQLVLNRQVEASIGCYWDYNLSEKARDCETSKELQDSFLKLPKGMDYPCQVCQRGLMMVSQIRLNNNINPSNAYIEQGSPSIIKGFDMSSFREMEREYEHNSYKHPHGFNTNKKLVNICCNVIKNGDFNISDSTDYLEKWGLQVKD